MSWILVLAVLAWVRPLGLQSIRALHILQLEEYQSARFWRWTTQHLSDALNDICLVDCGAAIILAVLLPWPSWLIAPILLIAVGAWRSVVERPAEARKPLVFTARAKRLYGSWVVLAILIAAVSLYLGTRSVSSTSSALTPAPFVAAVSAVGVVALIAWPLMILANLVIFPVEEGYRRYYLRDAAATLARIKPWVIGITGSYGKTSTKNFLTHILGAKYHVLQTPRSFNTPMGLCRVIREQLRPEHEYFVVELGAYGRGEIRGLCELVRPAIGILTAIGPQHLERFGSLDNVARAKWELVEALPSDGLAVLNGEDPIVRARAIAPETAPPCVYHLVGDSPPDSSGSASSFLRADEVRLGPEGLSFLLRTSDGRSAPTTTRLLGRHNVTNILCAAAVALHCRMTIEEVAAAIATLEPVEHRLQLVPNNNGVVIIDDGYNSNPRGAAGALEVLGSFAGGRRYLVTPGMVELGALEVQEHRAFGRSAAAVCDGVILIGPKRTRPIAEGLAEEGFAADRIIVTRSLAEAQEHLKVLLRSGRRGTFRE